MSRGQFRPCSDLLSSVREYEGKVSHHAVHEPHEIDASDAETELVQAVVIVRRDIVWVTAHHIREFSHLLLEQSLAHVLAERGLVEERSQQSEAVHITQPLQRAAEHGRDKNHCYTGNLRVALTEENGSQVAKP